MSNENQIDKEYQSILDAFELPVVYKYASKFEQGSIKNHVKFIASDFYQSTESLADYPSKPVSKIIYG